MMPKTTITPPRPLNCFLLYRMDKQKEILEKCEGANHRDMSKIIAKWWKEASDEEKAPYKKKAKEEKKKHAELYPDYKYSPKKKTTPKRIYKRKTNSNFTSRTEENNRIMELIYDNSESLEAVSKPAKNNDCARKASVDNSAYPEIKIEPVDSSKLAYDIPEVASSDSESHPTDDSGSLFPENASSDYSISPVLSWKSSPDPCYYLITPFVESPCLSFSTRLPLQSFSSMIDSVSSHATELTTGYSTPSAVFSPISYHIEPPMFRSNSQEQFYSSPSHETYSSGVSTPTDLTPNINYVSDFSFSSDCDSINIQGTANPTFDSECYGSMSYCPPLGFQNESIYSFLNPNHVPQYIDPSFIMKY